MKLRENIVRRVTAGGRKYRVNLHFKNVFGMIEILGEKTLVPDAKAYLALKCVMKHPPKNAARCRALFEEVCSVVFPEDEKPQKHERYTDFEQDANLIRAAFWQVYGINLWRDNLTWQEFTALLEGLPNGCRYMDVIGIRAAPMPEATQYNHKERESLMKAKASVALRSTDGTEKKDIGLFSVAQTLIAYAEANGGMEHG